MTDWRKIDPKAFRVEDALEEVRAQVQRPNILVLGAAGAGKSSLIRAIFGDGLEEQPNIGAGRSATKEITPYTCPEKDVVLFDSPGYEIGKEANDHYHKTVIGFLDERCDMQERIHLAWYCVSCAQKKICDMDAHIVGELRRRSIPVTIVLTQIDQIGRVEYADLSKCVKEVFPELTYFNTYGGGSAEMRERLAAVIQTDQLIAWSQDQLDDALRFGFVASLAGDIDEKAKFVRRIVIPSYTTAAGGVAVSPIPLSDAVLLVPIQTTMTFHILRTFGIADRDGLIKTLVGSMLLPTVGKSAASMLAGSLIKFIPGTGSAVGIAANTAIATTFTLAMGLTVCEICRRYCEAKLAGKEPIFAEFFEADLIKQLFKAFLKEAGQKEAAQ